MLRPGAQAPQDPRDQQTGIRRLSDHIVESRLHGESTFQGGGGRSPDADQNAMAESGLCPHARGKNRDGIYVPQYQDDNLVLQHDIVGRPFRGFDYAEAAALKRLTVGCFAARAVDDERRALFDVAICISHHTSAVGNGRAMSLQFPCDSQALERYRISALSPAILTSTIRRPR